MAKVKTTRWAWDLTGSGRFFKECLRMLGELDDADLFVRPTATRLFVDPTASAPPVGLFYYSTYHRLMLETEASKGMVNIYPREIDLKNTERLKSLESTVFVESLEDLRPALGRRRRELHG